MARIVGGIGLSHVPSVGPVVDRGKQETPAWKPLFDAYVPVREWLAQLKPDVAIVVYNDHGADFSFDKYPTFAIGAADIVRRSPTRASARGRCRRCQAMPNFPSTCAKPGRRRSSTSRSARRWASSTASWCR